MRIYEAIERIFMSIAPIDPSQQKELAEAVRQDYTDVLSSYNSKVAHNKACVEADSKAQREKVKDYKPEPKKAFTLGEKVIHFLENPYVRYGIWAVSIFGLAAIKRYLRRMQDDLNETTGDSSPMSEFMEYMQFKKQKQQIM